VKLPDKLPSVSGTNGVAQGFRIAFKAINQLIDYCRSLTPARSQDVITTRTAIGTTRKGNPATVPGSGWNWRGEWELGETYAVDDVVIRKSENDYNDGSIAGTYIKVEAAPEGEEFVAPTHGYGGWELLSKSHFDHLLIRGTSLAEGYIDLNVAATLGLPLAVRRIDTCEDGIPKWRLFVCSEAQDP